MANVSRFFGSRAKLHLAYFAYPGISASVLMDRVYSFVPRSCWQYSVNSKPMVSKSLTSFRSLSKSCIIASMFQIPFSLKFASAFIRVLLRMCSRSFRCGVVYPLLSRKRARVVAFVLVGLRSFSIMKNQKQIC